MAPNSTVELGYCSFLEAERLLKINTVYGGVEKENSEEMFVFSPHISKGKLELKWCVGFMPICTNTCIFMS